MPNLGYLLVSLAYNLGLALWLGGTIVLGVAVAPTLFRNLDRSTAGDIFGTVLGTFLRIRALAILLIVAGAGVKFALWEGGRAGVAPWIMIRWSLIALLAFVVLYELTYLEPALRRSLAMKRREDNVDGPGGQRFGVLHRRSELLMKGTFFVAMGALVLG